MCAKVSTFCTIH